MILENMTYKEALATFNKLENNKDTTPLFNFLQNLITQTENLLVAGADDAFRFQPIFEQCLFHNYSGIKQCGIEGILSTMHLEDEKYVKKAFEFLYAKIPLNEYGFWDDYEIDSDLKLWSASGLGAAFHGTKDKKIIKGLLKAIEINKENNGEYSGGDGVRVNCFKSILEIYYDYRSNEIMEINLDMNYEDIDFAKYNFKEILDYATST